MSFSHEPQGKPPADASQEISSCAIRMDNIFSALRRLLFRPEHTEGLPQRVDGIAMKLMALVAEDADHALYLTLGKLSTSHGLYSVHHALQCAVVCQLLAPRLKWSALECETLVRAALTMNIAMTDLQGTLAEQKWPLRVEQRAVIESHAQRGSDMLRHAGVQDSLWLKIVEQHHGQPDGGGDPTETHEVGRLANALQKVDEFTAMLAARATRPALSTRAAAAKIFGRGPHDPVVVAIIKELGIYPPRLVGALGERPHRRGRASRQKHQCAARGLPDQS